MKITLCLALGIAMAWPVAPGLAQKKELRNWPAGTSPGEIGKRVAANLIPRNHTLQKPTVHYAEDSAWYASLRFARLSGDNDLLRELIRKFDPILTPEGKQSISMTRHVDHAVFGIVPLEIYLQTPRVLPEPSALQRRLPRPGSGGLVRDGAAAVNRGSAR